MGINAQTSVPKFTSGDVLTAANTNLLTNAPPVFSGTATRDAAFGGSGEKTLAEGQLCYLEDSNIVQYYDGAAWATVGPASSGAVVQVKSTSKTDTFSTSSTSFTDVTGLSVAITPTSASNKILVMAAPSISTDGSTVAIYYRIMRDSTAIAIGDASSLRTRATGNSYPNGGIATSVPMTFLDSPATTSATTYKIQVILNGSGSGYVNRNNSNSDSAAISVVLSTITVMEVTP